MNKRIIMFLMLVLASLPFALFAAKTAAPNLPSGGLSPTSGGRIFR